MHIIPVSIKIPCQIKYLFKPAQLLGMRMGESKSPLRQGFLGGGLLVLACLTPYLGWFVFTPAMVCTSIGAGLLALFQHKGSALVEKKIA
jgi:hypothetical protein